ncbi:hypothetical protein N180_01755 [Pedobacter antarcticus 4BY]|uniref:Uncharacterized protein n=2 Tax=Pedobacter antarcticus TaxID=34086 RepID=A0A081PCG0_9SPHI|nr:hypothetical protein [Pedobacter antarcticus]KEQ28383.1 hypothetical protein N180_01755 [Pedobacter antarcticus 4BY]SFF05324.1 hypothetical protein SAMN03003324_02264 [Pedobacter antarcticus]
MYDISIAIPESLQSDFIGYSFMSKLAGESLLHSKLSIKIDFQNCSLIEGNLCAILGNILEGLIERDNIIDIANVTPATLRSLANNGFLEKFNYPYSVPKYHTNSVQFKKFNLNDETRAKDFFDSELFGKEGMPQMSVAAKKAILRSIFEICVNAITHAGCEYVYCCGQFFKGNNNPRATITFVDLGKTITANVNRHLKLLLNGIEAIKWALQEGNTTKFGDEPGGLGLKLLQDLLFYNKGKLQMISGNGFVEIIDKIITTTELQYDFPGTIVTIELKLGDPNFYILDTEDEETQNIF